MHMGIQKFTQSIDGCNRTLIILSRYCNTICCYVVNKNNIQIIFCAEIIALDNYKAHINLSTDQIT